MLVSNKYLLSKLKKRITVHTVQEVITNEGVEIRIDTRVKTKLT
jgi:hypothetical protein